MHIDRRTLLTLAGLAWPALGWASADGAYRALRAGGVVLAMRHARAPGTFDPPEFKLGDCRTQRNLDEAGRAQARAIGERLRGAGLRPERVRSSPWCRCVDTATLAFGQAETWDALSSPVGHDRALYARRLDELRAALAARAAAGGGFEVWVTHMFVLQALTGENTASGEGLVLGVGPDGAPRVLATLPA